MKALLKRITSFIDVEREIENQLGVIVEDVAFTTADTSVTITHNLGIEATGYIPVKKSKGGDFYFVSSTNTDLVLKSTVDSITASFRIF